MTEQEFHNACNLLYNHGLSDDEIIALFNEIIEEIKKGGNKQC
jgi:chorismate mutase